MLFFLLIFVYFFQLRATDEGSRRQRRGLHPAICLVPTPTRHVRLGVSTLEYTLYTLLYLDIKQDITPHLTTTASFFSCFLHPLSFCYSPEREKNMERVRHPLFSASAFCFRSRRSQCSCRLHKISLVLFSHPTKKSRRTYESWPVNQHDATFKTIKGDCHVVIVKLGYRKSFQQKQELDRIKRLSFCCATSLIIVPFPLARNQDRVQENIVCPAEKPARGPPCIRFVLGCV